LGKERCLRRKGKNHQQFRAQKSIYGREKEGDSSLFMQEKGKRKFVKRVRGKEEGKGEKDSGMIDRQRRREVAVQGQKDTASRSQKEEWGGRKMFPQKRVSNRFRPSGEKETAPGEPQLKMAGIE